MELRSALGAKAAYLTTTRRAAGLRNPNLEVIREATGLPRAAKCSLSLFSLGTSVPIAAARNSGRLHRTTLGKCELQRNAGHRKAAAMVQQMQSSLMKASTVWMFITGSEERLLLNCYSGPSYASDEISREHRGIAAVTVPSIPNSGRRGESTSEESYRVLERLKGIHIHERLGL